MIAATTFGIDGPVLSARERDFHRQAQPWGFILFKRNVESPDQLRRLTSELRDCVGREAPILIDQEGGRVDRLGPPHWPTHVPPLDEAAGAPLPVRAAALKDRYRRIASDLRATGIDVNCAPALDIAYPDTHPFLRNRCYGETAEDVAVLGRAVADGLMEGGVLPVMKHMPGHGRGRVDSHHDLPRTDAPRPVLEAEDFAPFRALSDLPMGMTAHMVFEDIDPTVPATASPKMVQTVREQIGFDGLLMTDDIGMNALSGTVEERVATSLAAGCDLILHCNGDIDERERVAAVVPALAGRAAVRADAALALRPRETAHA
ncbi:MAG: glycoside hydrolase family 3 N-terminal domain-containing protein [Pseudomonadota bacterium]